MTTLEDVLEIQKQYYILQAPTKSAAKFTAATASTLDIALKNTTSSSNCWAYVTGLDITKNNAVFILQSDGVTPYYPTSPSDPTTPLQEDCHIKLGAPGSSKTVTVPRIAGGRVWLCKDSQLTFHLNPGPALVEPSVTNPADSNYNLFWTFAEFTFNDFQLFGNITYVDFVGLPVSLTLENESGQVQNVQGVPTNGLDDVCAKLEDQDANDGAGWGQLVIKDPSGARLRALSPNSAIVMTPKLLEGYYQPYVNAVWAKYSSDTLSVDTQNKWGIVTGKVEDGKLTFPDIGDFTQPSARDIFACNSGPFADRTTNRDAMGNITARLAAAFNRSTLLTNSNQPDGEVISNYYRESITNHYSRIVHEVVADGRGYAFPYDDVAASDDTNVAGTVADTNPKLFTVTFGGLDATSGLVTRVPVSQLARSGGSRRQQVGGGRIFPRWAPAAPAPQPRHHHHRRHLLPADEEKAALAERDAIATNGDGNADLESGLAKLLAEADAAIAAPAQASRGAVLPTAVRTLLERLGVVRGGGVAVRTRARPALDAVIAAAAEVLRVSVGSLVGRAVVVAILVFGSFVLGLLWPAGEAVVDGGV